MALKKVIIPVMLSALLIGSTAIPIYAVEDKESSVDTVTDEVELEEEDEEEEEEKYDPWGSEESELSEESEDSEQSEESENTEASKEESVIQESEQSQEQSKEESKQESKEESKVQEQSKDESKEESKIQEQSKEESKTEESSTEIKTGKQKIEITVNLNCDTASTSGFEGTVDFSNIKLSLMSADGKTLIKKLDAYSKLSENETVSSITFFEEVPDWGKDGIKYMIKAENLPSVYNSSTYEMPFECKVLVGDYGATLNGITYPVTVSLDNIIEYTDLIFVYDREFKLVGNVPIKVYGYNSENKLIYNDTIKSNKDGYAFLNLSDKIDDIVNIQFSSNAVLNGGVITGNATYDYSRDNKLLGVKGKYILQADTDYKDLLVDDEGNEYSDTCDIEFNADFKDSDDMILFNHTDLNIGLYHDNDIFSCLTFSKEVNKQNLELVAGSKYTIKGVESIDYAVSTNISTLIVKSGTIVNILATPQIKLKIINKDENGNALKAHFKVDSINKEYNENEHIFSVNKNMGYRITNMESGETYDVFVGQHKETVLNIYDGYIKYSGEISDDNIITTDSTNTSSGSNISPTDVYSVPKTGDIVFSIIMILTGITGLSYLGYIHFKRKGRKHNEAKK